MDRESWMVVLRERSCDVTRWIAVVIVVLAVCATGAAARDWIALEEVVPGGSEATALVVSSDRQATVIEVGIPGVHVGRGSDAVPGAVDLEIPGAAKSQVPGAPNVPVLSYLVAIPDRGGVELEIVSQSERVFDGYKISPAAPFGVEGEPAIRATPGQAVYSRDALYPAEVAVVGEPMIMRDLRLVQVRVHPVRVNPVTGRMVVTENVELRLNYTNDDGVNEKRVIRPFRSEAFEPIYRTAVLNYGELPAAPIVRGSYLVIAQDTYVTAMADFVQWKQQRGIETVLVPLSDIGPSPSNEDIKDYIQTAYDTWDSPPDYVMLVGDTWTGGPAFPCFHVSTGGPLEPTDHPYVELEGVDYFPDAMIGRMSVDSATDAVVAGLKVLSYERDCDAPSDDWYTRALMVAGNFGGEHITSPRQTTLRVREMFYRAGYAQVDTIYYPPVTSSVPIATAINSGVGYVCYRGWGDAEGWDYPEFKVDDINALTNNQKLPVMMSIVCGTGNYDSFGYDPCFAEAWIRAGAPGALKGGPAAVAPSHFFTRTRWNNSICIGMYEGFLFEDLRHFAQAVLRGKMEMYKNFPLDTDPGEVVEFYFNIYNTIGDPELYLRTGEPATIVATHDATIPLGQNMLDIEVVDDSANYVPGAEVIVWKEGESYEVRSLDNGHTITCPINATTTGTVYVTVFAKNHKPYTGTVTVTAPSTYAGYFSHVIDDDGAGGSSGNGDGVINPGETIELNVSLKNHGTVTATNVQCEAEVINPREWVTVTQNLSAYDDIGGSVVEAGIDDFVLAIGGGCPNGTEIVVELTATGDEGKWDSEARLVVGAPVLEYFSMTVSGDGVLDPGETATLTVALANGGPQDATAVAGTLVGPTSGLTVTDANGVWGTVPSGGMASNSGNTFSVSAAANVAVGHEFLMLIDLTGDSGLSQFVVFPLVVGTPTANDPLGPDDYGYYGYDDTDTAYGEAPTYSWVEIDPNYGGSGTDVGLGYEDVTDLTLPFTFRYYGQYYDTIAVCSNGDVGMGGAPVWEWQPRNTTIPSPLGPDAMIAPFWDNLVPEHPDTGGVLPAGTGEVYTKDMGDGRFVVEWSRVGTAYDNGGNTQTFELILYDQDVYTTSTGDGEILFQYHTIADSDTHNYATVGIENPTQSDGLLCTFFSVLSTETAPLAAGRAIKFTTDPPDGYPATGVDEVSIAGVVLDGNRPNPFNPVTSIRYAVPSRGRVELSVYDVAGRRVATLVDGEVDGGYHDAVWNGTTDSGEGVATGIYFARLSAFGEERTQKMILLK
jgi:hypothetical protein